MLQPITLGVRLFRTDDPAEGERSRRALTWLMGGLVSVNREFLRAYPQAPSLYESAVVYVPETETELWQDVPSLLAAGSGDCEDLACYRCADLQAREGILALPYVTWREVGGRTIYHALVRYPDGRIEDPSLALGMRGAAVVRRPIFIGLDPP